LSIFLALVEYSSAVVNDIQKTH